MTVDWSRALEELQRAWVALGGRQAPGEVLLEAWSEPHRRYHNREHLAGGLEFLRTTALPFERPEEVLVAWWFHDAVYDTHRADNEEASAVWARRALMEDGVGEAVAGRVEGLVMATKHGHGVPEGDGALLVDIDLAILGMPTDRFDRYEREVREEYGWVPEAAWVAGRRGVLEHFLALEPLFQHPQMRARFEERAKENLARSLRALR